MDTSELVTLVDDFALERVALGQWRPKTAAQTQRVLSDLVTYSGGSNLSDLADVCTASRTAWNRLSPQTESSYAYLFRRYVLWLIERQLVEPTLIDSVPKPRWTPRRHQVPGVDVDAVMASATERERLVLALMVHCGLRIIEVRRLQWQHVDLEKKILLARGKGSHERVVDLYDAYPIVSASCTHHARSEGYVVSSAHKWSAGLSGATVALDVRKAFARVGATVVPRHLRRVAALRRAEAGDTLEQIAAFLGHVHIDTTAGYLPPELRGLRSTVDRRSTDLGPGITSMIHSPLRQIRPKRVIPRAQLASCDTPLRIMGELFVDRHRNRWLDETTRHTKRVIADFCDSVDPVTHDNVVNWLATKNWAATTERTNMRWIRMFVRELVAVGYLDFDPTVEVGSRPVPRNVPRELSSAECSLLLASLSSVTTKMIVTLILQQAMTTATIAALNVKDFDLEGMTVSIGETTMPLAWESVVAVRAHARSRRVTVGPLITTRGGSRISPSQVQLRVWKACSNADLPGGAAVLRATAISGIVKSSAPLHAVRGAVGHVDLGSTLRHTRPGRRRAEVQPVAWSGPRLVSSTHYLDRHEAARLIGVCPEQIRNLAAKLGIAGERSTSGIWLLTSEELARIREHRAANLRGSPLTVPRATVDEIVRLVHDDRSFVWIAQHLNRLGVPVGARVTPWTARQVTTLYWRRTNDGQ